MDFGSRCRYLEQLKDRLNAESRLEFVLKSEENDVWVTCISEECEHGQINNSRNLNVAKSNWEFGKYFKDVDTLEEACDVIIAKFPSERSRL